MLGKCSVQFWLSHRRRWGCYKFSLPFNNGSWFNLLTLNPNEKGTVWNCLQTPNSAMPLCQPTDEKSSNLWWPWGAMELQFTQHIKKKVLQISQHNKKKGGENHKFLLALIFTLCDDLILLLLLPFYLIRQPWSSVLMSLLHPELPERFSSLMTQMTELNCDKEERLCHVRAELPSGFSQPEPGLNE